MKGGPRLPCVMRPIPRTGPRLAAQAYGGETSSVATTPA